MSSSSSSTSEPLSLLATCAPGLEPLLAAELRERGFEVGDEEPGGVAFTGDRAAMQRANRELGLALSVLWRLTRFKAHDFRELEKRLARVPFASFLPKGANLRCRALSRRSRLYHTGALEERLARAAHAQLGDPVERGPSFTLLLRLDRERASLSLDTSGEPLYRRGYRLASGPAPLRADVACGLLRAAGYHGQRPLFDAMTGTGTLAIEAVRLACGGLPLRVPRGYAYQQLPGAVAELAEPDLNSGEAGPGLAPAVVARDRDARAVERARRNAAQAGIEAAVHWEVGGLSEPGAADDLEGALIVANPPHGKRLGDRDSLGKLYAALGRRTRELGAQLALLTSDAKLAAQTGLGLESALLTDLGGHKVRFYLSP